MPSARARSARAKRFNTSVASSSREAHAVVAHLELGEAIRGLAHLDLEPARQAASTSGRC